MGYLLSSVLSPSTIAVELVKLTAEHFTRNEHMDAGSKEQSEDGANHHDQEPYSRLLRTISVGEPASNDKTDDLTSTRTVRQTRLPPRRHLVFLFRSIPFAILFVEDGRSVEIAEKCQIVTLWWSMLALLLKRQRSACPLTHDQSAAEQG